MAICDSELKFTFIDVGQAGRWSDSGVFEASSFGNDLLSGYKYHIEMAFILYEFSCEHLIDLSLQTCCYKCHTEMVFSQYEFQWDNLGLVSE
ncbi:hypothetical protein EB796_006702 [Bugula neritina]|uniref:Uncharacterized protein n=1 Tax=Bugula neritina TaxID=10212 RepID=A0A7J7K9U0_BUGNE|nr:hypothetical protein EB796_006702 [Bugula neritina]